MWSRSHRAASPAEVLETPPANRRCRHRQSLRKLAYVKVDSTNGGIVLDIGERGLAARVVLALHVNQAVRLQIDLPDPGLHFEAQGRVAWADASGQAGIELLEISPRSNRMLKDWLFTQILADAWRVHGNTGAELLFSNTSRPAIRVQPKSRPREQSLRLLWLPVSAPGFARLVDGLALLCATLLFSVLSLSLIDVLPGWSTAAAVVSGACGLFALLYWSLFSLWFKTTPGRRLAELAGGRPTAAPIEDPRLR